MDCDIKFYINFQNLGENRCLSKMDCGIKFYGSKIQATVTANMTTKIKGKLSKGRVIPIKHFEVAKNTPIQAAKINHPHMILIKHGTLVDEYTEPIKITENGFQFVPFGDLSPIDKNCTVDVLGRVDMLMDKEYVESCGNAPKCELSLTDAEGRQLTCTLWGDYLDQWMKFVEDEKLVVGVLVYVNNNLVIVVAQFFMIKSFKSTRVLGGSIPLLHSFIGSGIYHPFLGSYDELLQKDNVSLVCELVASEKAGACSDTKCNRKVEGKDVGDSCVYCNTIIRNIIPRFMIIVKAVDDNDDVIKLKLFDNIASYFITKFALQVLDEMETDGQESGLPESFDKMLFKECFFKIDVS